MIKKFGLLFTLVLSLVVLGVSVYAEGALDPQMPESWAVAPQKAVDLGITEFNESPMLKEMVENGEIPTLAERLPENPPVVEPYEKVGKYGGTVTIWNTELSGGQEIGNWTRFGGGRTIYNGSVAPSYLEGWEYSNDYKDITIQLRKGLKYSNGNVMNADDYLYWWEHIANNSDLTAQDPSEWDIPLLDVVKKDDWTVVFKYAKPNPKVHFNFRLGMSPAPFAIIADSEDMENYHPDYIGEDKALQLAEENGFNNWFDYYNKVEEAASQVPDFSLRGILNPYIPVEKTETTIIFERNPYYPFVDTEGNQLPYIDRIKVRLANNREMAAMKATTGEATFASEHLNVSDIPLYKRNEANENYKTYIYQQPFGSAFVFYLNYTHEDPEYQKVFQDVKFRRALSISIDRDRINNKVFFGKAVPRAATVPPVNEYFKQEYADAYAYYNPDEANKWLDEIGMIDTDNDGYRETPGGEEFNPTLIYTQYELDPTPILELLREDLKKVGLKLDIKMLDFSLWYEKWPTNTSDMSGWSMNGGLGLRFKSLDGLCEFAPVIYPGYVQWPEYVRWHQSDGEKGTEPPEAIKKLPGWAETIVGSPNEEEVAEAAENLLSSMAKNLWVIGTVGLPPKPIIVSDNLKNVPTTGFWGTSTEYSRPYHTDQFYLDE